MAEKKNSGFNIEKLMSYVAVFVATIAAFAALYEAKLNREHQAISVWPYLEMWTGIAFSNETSGDGQSTFSFNIANKGLGPAIIENLELSYKDKSYDSWYELVLDVAKEHNLDLSDVRNTLSEAGLQPGEVIEASEVRWIIRSKSVNLAKVMSKAVYMDKAISYKACYCSLFKDCWTLTFPESRPKEIEACRVEDE